MPSEPAFVYDPDRPDTLWSLARGGHPAVSESSRTATTRHGRARSLTSTSTVTPRPGPPDPYTGGGLDALAMTAAKNPIFEKVRFALPRGAFDSRTLSKLQAVIEMRRGTWIMEDRPDASTLLVIPTEPHDNLGNRKTVDLFCSGGDPRTTTHATMVSAASIFSADSRDLWTIMPFTPPPIRTIQPLPIPKSSGEDVTTGRKSKPKPEYSRVKMDDMDKFWDYILAAQKHDWEHGGSWRGFYKTFPRTDLAGIKTSDAARAFYRKYKTILHTQLEDYLPSSKSGAPQSVRLKDGSDSVVGAKGKDDSSHIKQQARPTDSAESVKTETLGSHAEHDTSGLQAFDRTSSPSRAGDEEESQYEQGKDDDLGGHTNSSTQSRSSSPSVSLPATESETESEPPPAYVLDADVVPPLPTSPRVDPGRNKRPCVSEDLDDEAVDSQLDVDWVPSRPRSLCTRSNVTDFPSDDNGNFGGLHPAALDELLYRIAHDSRLSGDAKRRFESHTLFSFPLSFVEDCLEAEAEDVLDHVLGALGLQVDLIASHDILLLPHLSESGTPAGVGWIDYQRKCRMLVHPVLSRSSLKSLFDTLDWVLADLQTALKWDIEGVEWEWIPICIDLPTESWAAGLLPVLLALTRDRSDAEATRTASSACKLQGEAGLADKLKGFILSRGADSGER